MSNNSYRLIKKYPLSMGIGTVVKRVTGGYMSDSLMFFHKEAIENYPEFWEEIKCDILMHTTEDGVLVYKLKHPRLYWVQLKNFNMGIDYENSLSDIDTKNYKYFYCEKNAKDWIEKNRPEVKFTTEDGVGINSNKKLYGVVLGDFYPDKAFDLVKHEYTYNASINLKDFKWFVDKGKAIAYINLNKPVYSMRDLLNAKVLSSDAAGYPAMLIDLNKLRK